MITKSMKYCISDDVSLVQPNCTTVLIATNCCNVSHYYLNGVKDQEFVTFFNKYSPRNEFEVSPYPTGKTILFLTQVISNFNAKLDVYPNEIIVNSLLWRL